MTQTLRFLFIGDVVGLPGMVIFQRWIAKLKQEHNIDAVIVNGENAAKNGKGLTLKNIEFFKHSGVSVITTGNHVWEHKEIYTALNERDDIIRPANYPPGCPGKGHTLFQVQGHTVAIVNLMGRGFVRDMLDCPFRTIESSLTFLKTRTNIIFIDFHAEATAEKRAFGGFVDGKVSGVLGTHTHVQTADECIMPKGTAFMTDLGSCCALNSVIGVKEEQIINRFLYHPFMGRFVVATQGPIVLSGAWVEVDTATGKALRIERVRIVDDTLGSILDNESDLGQS